MKKIWLLLLFISSTANALTLADIRNQTRRYLADMNVSSAMEIWNNDELNHIINQGQRVVSDATWCIKTSTSISLTADTTYYNLPTDFYVTDRVVYANEPLLEITIEKLDRDDSTWLQTSTGTPTNYYINKERTKVGVYPVVSAAKALPLDVWYIKVPTDLSADTDVPFSGISKYYSYHHLLTYYTVAHILLELGNPNMDRWFNLFDTGVGRMMDNIKVQPNYVPELLYERE